jgi:hypothetical protein
VAINPISSAELSQIEGQSLLDRSEVVQAIEYSSLSVSTLHVSKSVVTDYQVRRNESEGAALLLLSLFS